MTSMKTKKRWQSVLSVLLTLVMCVGIFAVALPGLLPVAEAATAGKYRLFITIYVDDSADKKENIQNEHSFWEFTYQKNNGTAGANPAPTYKYMMQEHYSTWLYKSSTKTNVTSYIDLDGFPSQLYIEHDAVWTDGVRYHVKSIKVSNTSVTDASKATEIWTGNVDVKSGGVGNSVDKETITIDSSKNPYVNTVTWANTNDVTISLSKTANRTGKTPTATVKDQYGVNWYQAPNYAIRTTAAANTTTTSTLAGYGITASASGDTCTVTCDYTKALDWVAGVTSGSRNVYVTAYLASSNSSVGTAKTSSTIKFILNNPTYKVYFYNGDGSKMSEQTVSYKKSATAPTDTPVLSPLTKNADDTNHYVFSGWDKSYSSITATTNVYPKFETAVAHTYGDWEPTDDAQHQRTCSVCGYVQSTAHNFPATWTIDGTSHKKVCPDCGKVLGGNHTYNDVVTAPTCETEGYTTHTCTICGYSYKDSYVDAKQHDWDYATGTDNGDGTHTVKCKNDPTHTKSVAHTYTDVVTPPTCETKGYTTHTCTVCGYSYTDDETAALTHAWDESVGTDDGNGSTHTISCTRDATHTKSVAHTYTDVVTAPTCEDQGYTTHTCTVCGYSYKDSYTDAIDHDWNEVVGTDDGNGSTHTIICKNDATHTKSVAHTYNDVVTPPTCEDQGYTTHTCTVCGYSYTDSYTNAIDHDWNEVAGTDDGNGSTHTIICKNDATHTKSVAHTYNDVVTPSTCEEQGYTTHTCTVCGYSYTDSYTAPLQHDYVYVDQGDGTHIGICSHDSSHKTVPAAHVFDYENGEITKPFDCGNNGEMTYTCSDCGATEAKIILATGNHVWTVTDEAVASCLEDGERSYACEVCHQKKTEKIYATGHKDRDNDGICDVCGTSLSRAEFPGKLCAYCHQVHRNDLWGKVTHVFHSIFAFIVGLTRK